MARRLYDIEQSAIDDLRDRLNDLISDNEITEVDQIEDEYHNELCDMISEIADSNVPIYTADLLQCALDNLYLATGEPELGPAFDGTPTPVNIIAANIYEHIEEKLWEYVRDDLDSDTKINLAEKRTRANYEIDLNGLFAPYRFEDIHDDGTCGIRHTFWNAFNACVEDALDNEFTTIMIEWRLNPKELDEKFREEMNTRVADRLITKQASRSTRKDA